MKKNSIYALIFIVLLIFVIVFCAVWFAKEDTQEADPQSANYEDASQPPEIQPDSVSDDPGESEAPEPEESPTAKPKETSTPTPSPSPEEPVKTSSGSFSSKTGTALNLVVNWTARTRPTGEIDITFDIGVSSYAFYTDSLPYSIELNVADTKYSLGSSAVGYDGQTQKTSALASYTATLPAGTETAEISVTWDYRGEYSGIEIDSISASDTISF